MCPSLGPCSVSQSLPTTLTVIYSSREGPWHRAAWSGLAGPEKPGWQCTCFSVPTNWGRCPSPRHPPPPNRCMVYGHNPAWMEPVGMKGDRCLGVGEGSRRHGCFIFSPPGLHPPGEALARDRQGPAPHGGQPGELRQTWACALPSSGPKGQEGPGEQPGPISEKPASEVWSEATPSGPQGGRRAKHQPLCPLLPGRGAPRGQAPTFLCLPLG